MFEYVLLKQSRSDFIERLFYYQSRGKIQKYRGFMRYGVAKTKTGYAFSNKPYSSFIYTPTLKIYLLLIIKNPIKIRQICHSDKIYPLSYPISSKPTKIKHLTHFTTQKSNSHLTKNLPTNSKLSLFISTFTDNDFSSKNSKLYTLTQGLP